MTEETKEVEKAEEKYAQIAVEKNNRTYLFMIPIGSPLGEAFDASIEASRVLVSMAQKYVDEKPTEDEETENDKKE